MCKSPARMNNKKMREVETCESRFIEPHDPALITGKSYYIENDDGIVKKDRMRHHTSVVKLLGALKKADIAYAEGGFNEEGNVLDAQQEFRLRTNILYIESMLAEHGVEARY